MNLLLLDPDDFIADDQVCIGGRRLEHVRKIHRATVGDHLRVGVVNGRIGSARLTLLEKRQMELRIEHLDREPPPPSPVTLAVALPRPPSMQKVLQHGTAMGVKHFVFFHSRRVEKSYWDSSAMEEAAIEEHLRLGLEQGVDTVMPRVERIQRFLPFVEDRLPELPQPVWVAHPEGGDAVPEQAARTPITVVIGPEGGFVPFEVERLAALGHRCLSLGPRILRVEAATIALLARLGLPGQNAG